MENNYCTVTTVIWFQGFKYIIILQDLKTTFLHFDLSIFLYLK